MSARAGAGRPLPSRWIIVLTVLLFAVPVLVDLALSDRSSPFRYLAADAFYYLTIGRNFVQHGWITFDQTTPTNGFHPLWQLVVCALYWLLHVLGLSELTFVYAVVLVNLAMVAAAIALLGIAIRDLGGHVPLLFVGLPVGLYALLIAPPWIALLMKGTLGDHFGEGSQPLYGTAWSFVNGMESPLVLLFVAAFAALFAKHHTLPTNRSAIQLGLLLSALTLARLDHGLIAATVVGLVFLRAIARDRSTWRRATLLGVAFAIPIISYLVVNQIYAGSMMPVSGKLKTTFPTPSGDFFEVLARMGRHQLSAGWLFYYWRLTQVLLPMLAAAGVLAHAAIGWRSERRSGATDSSTGLAYRELMVLLALGVLALGGYNLVFVRLFAQGHWYFPASTLFVTLVALYLVGQRFRERPARSAVVAWGLVAVVTALTCVCFVKLHRLPDYHAKFAKFYLKDAKQVAAYYAGRDIKIFSRDDGIVAFSLPFPTMSGTGLAGDPEAVRYYQEGRLLELALARGYDRVTSLVYWNCSGLRVGAHPREIVPLIEWWKVQTDTSRMIFRVEYANQDRDFAMVLVRPR